MTLELLDLALPDSLESEAGALYVQFCEVWNEDFRRNTGVDYLRRDPANALAELRITTDRSYRRTLVVIDGKPVGAGSLSWSHDTEKTAHLSAAALADEARVYELLIERLEAQAREAGRSVCEAWAIARARPEAPQASPPSGIGEIPADDPYVAALIRAGYRLAQVERMSAITPGDHVDRLQRTLADAEEAAGDDYRVEQWTTPTPQRWKKGYAAALQRMETDVPTGDREVEAQTIDVARLDRDEAASLAGGYSKLVTAVIHTPSGEVAAFNELSQAAEEGSCGHTGGTLVMPEHRGKRLGALVKCAGLLRCFELWPQSPAVTTWNAEENRFMLDTNELVGFVPLAYEGIFTKDMT